ncbi:MAG: GMC family oxidoreductase [bacterium]|nr:GMC family oxidoreductase [bacterium]
MALIDARTLSGHDAIESDLCIVGAGAAGLAIASQLADSGLRIALLESGGLNPDPKTQSLYTGQMVGQPDAELHQSRLRYFGGTTNHWSAHVRPLEPIDFDSRAWIPHSGWPIGLSDLAPYYARAREFLHLPVTAFDLRARAQAIRHQPWVFPEDRVLTQVIQIVTKKHRRLGRTLRYRIRASRSIRTYLFANVLRLHTSESGKRITKLTIGTLNGRRLSARARHYVLAMGGIENARLLLLSSQEGLGRDGGLVGRFFANHLEAGVGQLVPGGKHRTEFYWKRGPAAQSYAALRLARGTLAAGKLANCRIQMIPARPKRASGLDLDIARVVADTDAMSAGRLGLAGGKHAPSLNLHAIVEPVPNPDSRVRLGSERDIFGQRKVALDWRLSDFDSASLHRTLDQLAVEVGASGFGRINDLFPEDGFRSVDPRGSFHHMGTTRMHSDPGKGVVDADCRMHGSTNLHIAGSSVFPTYGTANPTFTILALAFRLAERLKDLLT